MPPTRLTIRLLAALIAGWLAGCSHTVPREAFPADLPPAVELDDTPFFPQEAYQCGPAALATVLGQRGVEVSPEALLPRVYLPQRRGSVAAEMVAAARSYGLVVLAIPQRLESLLREVAAGNPVLVLQNLGLSWLPRWHYAVVVGYSLEEQQLILRSGVYPRYRLSLATFERTWQRGGAWGVVVLPAGRLSASDIPQAYLMAVFALEQGHRDEEALQAYRSGLTRWHDSLSLALAQGNLEYRLGRFSEAEQTLRQALPYHPRSAVLWNNLAFPIARSGCLDVALGAVRCAIALDPQDSYRQSLEEVAAMAGAATTACRPLSCPVGESR